MMPRAPPACGESASHTCVAVAWDTQNQHLSYEEGEIALSFRHTGRGDELNPFLQERVVTTAVKWFTPHVRPMGSTCVRADKIKQCTHACDATAVTFSCLSCTGPKVLGGHLAHQVGHLVTNKRGILPFRWGIWAFFFWFCQFTCT